jgi:hypothetical protein
MPIPIEKVAASRCFRTSNNEYRKVLLMKDKVVTYILHEKLAWTVLRFYVHEDVFAQSCEAEIDYTTLKDIA